MNSSPSYQVNAFIDGIEWVYSQPNIYFGVLYCTLNNENRTYICFVDRIGFNSNRKSSNKFMLRYYFIPIDGKTSVTGIHHQDYQYLNTDSVPSFASTFAAAYPAATNITTVTKFDREVLEKLFSDYTSFHSDPVYAEATKLKYTDGTYNFIRGVVNADRARKAAYNSLLKTYGTFYKGTEEELASSFATELSDQQTLLNGGGGN